MKFTSFNTLVLSTLTSLRLIAAIPTPTESQSLSSRHGAPLPAPAGGALRDIILPREASPEAAPEFIIDDGVTRPTCLPTMTIQITQAAPDWHQDPGEMGTVSRHRRNNDIHTLVAIPIPATVKGTCVLKFLRPQGFTDKSWVTVYRLKEAFNDAASWNYRPKRNNTPLGTWQIERNLASQHVSQRSGERKFACPSGKTMYLEMAPGPHGTMDMVQWYQRPSVKEGWYVTTV